MEQLTYEGCFDFVDGTNTGNDYAYNANGALTKDQNKGITKIEYDLLGNPKKVTMSNSRSIEYVYAADGRRLRAIHKSGTISEKTDYIGSLILKNGKRQMFRFLGGYYEFGEKVDTIRDCHYYIADYLGNNRQVVNARTNVREQQTHYYPYGELISDISTAQDFQHFKYGGKELDRTFGLDLNDFHARQQDAKLGCFNAMDKKSEDYYGISPYAYCAGDPVNLVDPTGMILETGWDLFNFGLDCKSAYDNFSEGNIGAGCLDVLAGVGDGLAVVLPCIPGGLGTTLKVARAADKVVDTVKAADNATDVVKQLIKELMHLRRQIMFLRQLPLRLLFLRKIKLIEKILYHLPGREMHQDLKKMVLLLKSTMIVKVLMVHLWKCIRKIIEWDQITRKITPMGIRILLKLIDHNLEKL